MSFRRARKDKHFTKKSLQSKTYKSFGPKVEINYLDKLEVAFMPKKRAETKASMTLNKMNRVNAKKLNGHRYQRHGEKHYIGFFNGTYSEESDRESRQNSS